MKERDRILRKLYKNMALYDEVRNSFISDWFYVYQLMEEGDDGEEEIPDIVLEMIENWLDISF